MLTAYDSPVWFYVFLVPVFACLAACMLALGYAIYKEASRER